MFFENGRNIRIFKRAWKFPKTYTVIYIRAQELFTYINICFQNLWRDIISMKCLKKITLKCLRCIKF